MTEQKCLNLLKRDWESMASNPDLINEAKVWYPNEHDFSKGLAIQYNWNLQQITGLYACFSPMKSVNENKKILVNFLKGKRYGHTSQQINKAELILQTSDLNQIDVILGGMKTRAFHRHIYNPMDKEVTCIDRHCIKYFNQGKMPWITSNRYNMYSNAIKRWSDKVNMYPSEVQALVWLYAKQKYGNNV